MRKGIPVSARLPMIRAVVVNGIALNKPPVLRISCSSFRLLMIEPEHMNNMALKKAWVQM